MAVVLMVCVPRFGTLRGRRKSFGGEVGELALLLGGGLMPHQQLIVDVALQFGRGGRPRFHDVVYSMPRQNGKSWVAAVVSAWWALKWEDQHVMFLAQTRTAAASRMSDLAKALVRAGVECQWYRGVGNESIRFPNGSVISIESPNIHGSHGESFDLIMLDEAFSYEEYVLQGVLPTQVARPNSQLWMYSTQGSEASEVWNRYVERGRESVDDPDSVMAYFEWSMDVEGGVDDLHVLSTYGNWMPAIGFTVDAKDVQPGLLAMSPGEARRAYGNVMTLVSDEIFSGEWWSDAFDPHVSPDGGVVLAFDVNVSPAGASIAMAFPTIDGGWHVDIAAYEPDEASLWLVDKVKYLVGKYAPVAVAAAGGSPARAVIPELQEFCDQRLLPFRSMTVQDLGGAAGLFYDGLRTGSLSHGVSGALDVAVSRAVSRDSADLWLFDRKLSRVDVSPLVAASVAVWVAAEAKAKQRSPQVFSFDPNN